MQHYILHQMKANNKPHTLVPGIWLYKLQIYFIDLCGMQDLIE